MFLYEGENSQCLLPRSRNGVMSNVLEKIKNKGINKRSTKNRLRSNEHNAPTYIYNYGLETNAKMK